MARIVVVGGGFAGLAAAARLAKLGHEVTLCERSAQLGGVVRTVEHAGFRWDAGPAAMTLPATIRDLFRKSGRPLERVLDLVPVTAPRRHLFADGSVLDLPLSGRSDQLRAFTGAVGEAAAKRWEGMVDDLTPTWELLRTRVLEVPYAGPRALGLSGLRRLGVGRSLRSAAHAAGGPDPKVRGILQSVLEYPTLAAGSDPRQTPGFAAVQAYVERTFGIWTCAGGFAPLVTALADRLAERRVDVRRNAEVTAIAADAGTVTGVRLRDGVELPADVVVTDVDVRSVVRDLLGTPPPRALRRAVARVRPAPASRMVCLGLRDDGGEHQDLPYETVVHGEAPGAPVVVRTPDGPALAPAGHRAVTVLAPQGRPAEGPVEDPLDLLAGRGLDLRDQVVARVEVEVPAYGPVWRGAWRGLGVPLNRSPIRGLFLAGGTAHPGPGVPYVLLGAAAIAQEIGPA
ncbi:phytoene desaturase family protein [Actinopolymorpha alba]|uniref:phytoene desaturase family protein n=1 Tax=Actinopolymorpha alba TaxID=533267 RepID=UPI000376DC1F|nr:FAD-dependent oxidoreductase [Actinopolymorpha alba]